MIRKHYCMFGTCIQYIHSPKGLLGTPVQFLICNLIIAWQARTIKMLGLGTHNWHTSIRGAG